MFNHAFDFAFEATSLRKDGSDVSPQMLREALLARANTLSDAELLEACGLYDTYEINA